ncbi:hypothetical protein Tco_0767950 [Tanacetum coccineum]
MSLMMIDIYNVSHDDYLEDLFAIEKITNHLSDDPTLISDPIVSSSPTLTSLEESDLIWEEFEAYLANDSFPPGSDDTNFDPEGDLRLSEELLNNNPLSHPPLSHNPLSGSTTSFSPDHLLKEFANELALITFPSRNDDLPFDIESDLREIEYLLNHDPTKEMDSILEDSVDEGNLADPNNDLVDTIPEMFTDEHTLDYSSPPLYDDVDDDLVELESDNDDVYDDPFDSKEDKIKESKLLIDELDSPGSSIFLPQFLECDSVFYEDFSEVDTLTSTDNEDKDFNPPLYELPFHKEVPGSEILLSFSSENEEKVFNPGILDMCTDIAKITRKRSKPDKLGHGKGKRIQEPGECYQRVIHHPKLSLVETHTSKDTWIVRKHTKMQDFTLIPLQKKHNGSDTRIATLAIRVLIKTIQGPRMKI